MSKRNDATYNTHAVSSYSVESFLDVLTLARMEYRGALEDEGGANDATQDVLHELELTTVSYHDRAKLAEKLQEIRRYRRQAKDHRELLQPLISWADENQAAVRNLKIALGEMRKLEDRHKNRIYSRRADPVGEIISAASARSGRKRDANGSTPD